MRIVRLFIVIVFASFCAAPVSAQQEMKKKEKMDHDKMEKMEQMKMSARAGVKEMLQDVSGVGEKWVSLFDAIPEDKLDWRPQEGVRSIRELFTHIADANFFFATIVGAKAPDRGPMPKDQNERENRHATKEAITKNLKASYEFTRKVIGDLSAETLHGELDMFGRKTTGLGAMMTNLGHMHEHLGQAIAYARVNGVTPPWSQGN